MNLRGKRISTNEENSILQKTLDINEPLKNFTKTLYYGIIMENQE